MQLGNLLEEDARTGQLRLIVPNASSRSAEGSVGEGAAVRRGVIRFLVVVIDASESMNQRDMRPSRIGVASQVVSTFIDNFFDQNPISQLALVELRQGKAEKITELSGNARHHRGRLEERVVASRGVGGGQASIRAGLEIAAQMLEMQASYGTREVLLVYGSLSSVDNGDIFETLARLQAGQVKVSCVGLAAELFVANRICKETGGSYKVATHVSELRDMILAHTTPAPVLEEKEVRADGISYPKTKLAAGMWVGFPKRKQAPLNGWECPRCHSLVPDVPADCPVCCLKLLSSSHLARSYHHLFPVPVFSSVQVVEDAGQRCRACGQGLSHGACAHECRRCKAPFCGECDGFIHEMLHVCPGCEAHYETDSTQMPE